MMEPMKTNKFVVYHPGIPSYLVHSYELGLDKFTLTMFVTKDQKIMDVVKSAGAGLTEIHYFDGNGKVIDKISVVTYKLLDWKVTGSWGSEECLHIKLIYDCRTMD